MTQKAISMTFNLKSTIESVPRAKRGVLSGRLLKPVVYIRYYNDCVALFMEDKDQLEVLREFLRVLIYETNGRNYVPMTTMQYTGLGQPFYNIRMGYIMTDIHADVFKALRLHEVFGDRTRIEFCGDIEFTASSEEAIELRGAYKLFREGSLTREDLKIFLYRNLKILGVEELKEYKRKVKYSDDERKAIDGLVEDLRLLYIKHTGDRPHAMQQALKSLVLLQADANRKELSGIDLENIERIGDNWNDFGYKLSSQKETRPIPPQEE